MVRYIYYCDECLTSLEVVARPAESTAPPVATCPVCGCEKARLLYAANPVTPPGGCCPPGTGCCGTPGST